jgi:hypothetical protein
LRYWKNKALEKCGKKEATYAWLIGTEDELQSPYMQEKI